MLQRQRGESLTSYRASARGRVRGCPAKAAITLNASVQVSFMCEMAPCSHIMEEMPMRKTITAILATAGVAATVIAAPKPAEARCIGCWVGAGIAAGVVAGA
jgi:hypothetical protein